MSAVAETLTYVDRWSEKWPTEFEELDEDEARRRHDAGELYTVLLGDPESPSAYIEVRLGVGYVGVLFLDENGRNNLTYLFAKDKTDDRLFLQQVSWRDYDEDGKIRNGTSYHFKRDGTIYSEEKDYEKQEAWKGEKQDDVSGNWEPVPEFGQYDSIARRDR
jgi:hypothetical protein